MKLKLNINNSRKPTVGFLEKLLKYNREKTQIIKLEFKKGA